MTRSSWRTVSAGRAIFRCPYAYSVIGAAWALTFTFALVAFAWRRPRFDPLKPGHPLPAALTALRGFARHPRGVAAGAALAFTVWVLLAGLCGPQTQANALLGVFYVLLWVGLVAVSLLFGPVWRVISPVRTVYLLLQRITPRTPRPSRGCPTRNPGGIARPRWACSRSCGWNWPAPTRPRCHGSKRGC